MSLVGRFFFLIYKYYDFEDKDISYAYIFR